MKKLKRIRQQLKYSESFKKARVKEFESGNFTVLQLSRMYGFHFQTLYNWIYKYSRINDKNTLIVELKDSSSERLKQFESRIKELEQALGRKQMKIDYLEKLIEITEGELSIDIKKNSDTSHLNGFQKTEGE